MKRQGKRHASQTIEHAATAETAVPVVFPPPDARTRVPLDLEPSAVRPGEGVMVRERSKPPVEGLEDGGHRRPPAGWIVSIGLGGLIVSVCSRIIDEAGFVDVPTSVGMGIAGAGGVLLAVGGVRGWRRRQTRERVLWQVSHLYVEQVDLPTITGQMSGVLAALRHEHGLAYTSGTWITSVLPRYTSTALDQVLARDLLAAAALDAGGIRANVSTIASTYSRTMIVDTCVALLGALEAVQVACESAKGELPQPQPSDPTGWPAELR